MSHRLHLGLLWVWVIGACAPTPDGARTVVKSPSFKITTEKSFDASGVKAYAGSAPDIYAHIDAHQAEHVANIQRWLRQPSISTEKKGIPEMAGLVRDDLKALGFQEAALVPTSGHPGVWGYYDAGAAKTLLIYMMYDVQPVEPADWRSPPFEAAVVDHELGKAIIGRGATNQKGPERAFLNALASIIAVRKKLPVNLMVAMEGEEELGSPHYPEMVDKFEARMKTASGVFFPFLSQNPDGSTSMFLGVKGILYFELEAKGGAWGGPSKAEIHSSYKTLVDAPAWRLTQALASLTSADGNSIQVPGYSDPIRAPNEEEQSLVNGMMKQWPEEETQTRERMGVARWVDSLSGQASLLRHLFTTTLNIDGIWSGYTQPGGRKTILPHQSTAKLDSRLVPDQTPDSGLALIKAHLAAKGFGDIEVRKLSGYPPAQTTVEAPFVQAAIGVFNNTDTPQAWRRAWPGVRRTMCSRNVSSCQWWLRASGMVPGPTHPMSTWSSRRSRARRSRGSPTSRSSMSISFTR